MSAKGQFEQHDVFAPSASLAKAYCSSWCLEDGEIVKNVSASFHGRPEDYDACQAILDVVKLPY